MRVGQKVRIKEDSITLAMMTCRVGHQYFGANGIKFISSFSFHEPATIDEVRRGRCLIGWEVGDSMWIDKEWLESIR